MTSPKQSLISRVIFDISTTANQDFCSCKISGHLLLLAFLALSGYAIIKTSEKFDPIAFAAGGTAIVTGTAAGVKIKDSTEPQPSSKDATDGQ